MSPWGDFQFVSNYCNQVNIWHSTDGVNWFRAGYLGTAVPAEPDAEHRVQRSRPDVRRRRPALQHRHRPRERLDLLVARRRRHLGQGHALLPQRRPAVARRRRRGPGVHGHEHARGRRVTASRSSSRPTAATPARRPASPAPATMADGTQLHGRRQALLRQADAGLRRARPIFEHGREVRRRDRHLEAAATPAVTPHLGIIGTSMFAHWPAIALDKAGTVYLVWDPDDAPGRNERRLLRATPTPAAEHDPDDLHEGSRQDVVEAGHDRRAVERPRLLAVGRGGRRRQGLGRLVPDRARASSPTTTARPPTSTSYDASIINATSVEPARSTPPRSSGRPIHTGRVCQGGTTCVATGQDRRLGDYFTNALDARGCVLIATGDTTLLDPTTGAPYPTARPLFIRQNAGPALIRPKSCSCAVAQLAFRVRPLGGLTLKRPVPMFREPAPSRSRRRDLSSGRAAHMPTRVGCRVLRRQSADCPSSQAQGKGYAVKPEDERGRPPRRPSRLS